MEIIRDIRKKKFKQAFKCIFFNLRQIFINNSIRILIEITLNIYTSVISILCFSYFNSYSYGIVYEDLPEDNKVTFESLLTFFYKKMSLIISFVVLFIMKIRFFPGKSIAHIIVMA